MANYIVLDYLFLDIGLVCLGIGVAIYFKSRARYSSWKHSEGVVLELVGARCSIGSGKGKTTLDAVAPRIEFESQDGQRITFQDAMFSTPAPAQVGEQVRVIYNPACPSEAMLDRWMRRHLREFCYFAIGAILMIIYGIKHFAT